LQAVVDIVKDTIQLRRSNTTAVAIQHFDIATEFDVHQPDRLHTRTASLFCWRQYVLIGKRHCLRDLKLEYRHMARLGHNLRTRHEAQYSIGLISLTKLGSWLSHGQLVHQPTTRTSSNHEPSNL
jgi:hypothetical protein